MFASAAKTLTAAIVAGSVLAMAASGPSYAREGGSDGAGPDVMKQLTECAELQRKITKTKKRLKRAKKVWHKTVHRTKLRKYQKEFAKNC